MNIYLIRNTVLPSKPQLFV